MDILLWILAGGALVLAWRAGGRAVGARDAVDSVKRDLMIREGDGEELRREIDGLRKLVALMAAGKPVDADMVKENRLYRNSNTVELQRLLEDGGRPYVIDVRTDQEWQGGHIPGAVHIPVEQLTDRLHEVARDGRDIYVTCAAGGRSSQAADYLAGRGYLNVFNVEGGMGAWRGPVER